jgi:hypothetical protein
MLNRFIKRIILLMIAVVVTGCANHRETLREARSKSVHLYPGLPQRQVVKLYGMPNKAEGNSDEDRKEDELVWEYDKIDLTITFIRGQAGWVVNDWKID